MQIKPKLTSPSRNHANISYEQEDDSNSNDDSAGGKPNLCRLCGKTYARPSTLKVNIQYHILYSHAERKLIILFSFSFIRHI